MTLAEMLALPKAQPSASAPTRTLADLLAMADPIEWVRWRMAIWSEDSGQLEVETAGGEPMPVWGIAVEWSAKEKGRPEVLFKRRDGEGSEAKAINHSWRMLCSGSTHFSSFPVSACSTCEWWAATIDWKAALSALGYAEPEYAAILNGRSWPWSLGIPTQVLGQPKWTQWSAWFDAKRKKP